MLENYISQTFQCAYNHYLPRFIDMRLKVRLYCRGNVSIFLSSPPRIFLKISFQSFRYEMLALVVVGATVGAVVGGLKASRSNVKRQTPGEKNFAISQ